MKTQIIPQHKFDLGAIENLKKYKIDEIREEVPFLLEWLQDGNWPVAHPISDYFLPCVNSIENELMDILKGEDAVWKYWILHLIFASNKMPGDELKNEVLRIAQFPTKDEIHEELQETALEIIEGLGINGNLK